MPIDRRRKDKKGIASPQRADMGEVDFDVMEWLEGERLEHERRMQELGCGGSSKKTGRW